jgi:hypothetical protein
LDDTAITSVTVVGIERYGCVGTISAISHRNTATQNRRVSASMRLCRPYLPEFDDGYVTDEKRTSNVITMNSNQSGRYNPMNGLLPFEADQQIENYMEDVVSKGNAMRHHPNETDYQLKQQLSIRK